MFPTVTASSPAEVSAGLVAAVDDAMALDVASLSPRDLAVLLQDWQVSANRAAIAMQRLVAELDARGAASDLGVRSTSELLVQMLRVSPWEAKQRVADARTFAPGRALSGAPLEPVVPLVATALETGGVSLPHGRVIAKLLDELPGDVEARFGVEVQEFLLEQATQVDPLTLGKLALPYVKLSTRTVSLTAQGRGNGAVALD